MNSPIQLDVDVDDDVDLDLDVEEIDLDPIMPRFVVNLKSGPSINYSKLCHSFICNNNGLTNSTQQSSESVHLRHRRPDEDYDLKDPFIDDSNAIVEGALLLEPTIEGFYLASGTLAVKSREGKSQTQANRKNPTKARPIAEIHLDELPETIRGMMVAFQSEFAEDCKVEREKEHPRLSSLPEKALIALDKVESYVQEVPISQQAARKVYKFMQGLICVNFETIRKNLKVRYAKASIPKITAQIEEKEKTIKTNINAAVASYKASLTFTDADGTDRVFRMNWESIGADLVDLFFLTEKINDVQAVATGKTKKKGKQTAENAHVEMIDKILKWWPNDMITKSQLKQALQRYQKKASTSAHEKESKKRKITDATSELPKKKTIIVLSHLPKLGTTDEKLPPNPWSDSHFAII